LEKEKDELAMELVGKLGGFDSMAKDLSDKAAELAALHEQLNLAQTNITMLTELNSELNI
jgi:hypothetical protein